MTFGMTVLIILVVLLAVLVAAFLYRLVILRRGGTAALLRVLPSPGDSGWRHGIIRYGESSFVFFKLSSLRPGPDSRVDRQGIEVESRRSPSGTEFDIMSDDIVVLRLRDGSSNYEIALDSGALTAFLSWVESRPDGRARRRRTA
ncbi:DUF2550 domain-containing protein [Rhodococcus sp. ACPA4]|uniref:Uncharacterized protein DUF2550 n=2 Tax=Nocardiaceae TaxID=85025 RepID=A0A652YIC8_NOCGL|nr:hypothetical protein SZ00_05859 [Rhodococcus sp. AD45]NRI67679.1 DUF2550 family protein [Rhodococcus sp. MS16]PBC38231.1 DUF2550 domain-containing protein [Rhodococcus sp. ACPA4]PSR39419.1 DUF2550 domain-containing protein [Rhodococcus sp. AD45-ID]PVX66622.1 uncharacterized protein DUF2550 [Rhodococcus globerulus]ROZ44638.1 DUF2550 family protein [Rhodococcus sp. WS3]RZL22975.1 MAG: DUF2550 family protein [Rhodococcus sp. (in: high G+C Gram-positive bacteria)]